MDSEQKTTYSLFLPVVFISIALLTVLGSCINPAVFSPVAKSGTIDLSSWDFQIQGAVTLSGEWDFFPGLLLDAPSGGTDTALPALMNIRVPEESLWQNVKGPKGSLGTYGTASYRLTMLFPRRSESLSLLIPEFFSASRIYFNGTEIFSAGKPAYTAEDTLPSYKTGIVSIVPRVGKNELVIQVANFSERRGGFNRSISIGKGNTIQTVYMKSLAMDIAIFGSLLTIGLYHLCLFWLRRQDRSPLWFGLFCIIIAVRSLVYGERFIFSLLPSISWATVNRIDHLSFYLGIPVFSAYISHIFERDISRPAMRVYQVLGLVFSCCLFFPPAVYNSTVVIYEIITGAYVLYIIIIIGYALAKKREGALTTVIGIALFLCFGINEILFNMGIVNTFNSLSIGLVMFLFTQSVLLAMRFSKAFDESEHLGKTLLTMNESLRRFIPHEFFQLLHRQEVDDIMLGDQVEKNMTIMFTDIRGFTTMAEQLGAAKTFEFLNSYFGFVGEVIRENGGFIDKYLGDGFIALFPDSPESALQAAIGIQKAVVELNREREGTDIPSISVGIGLNYGPLILGTVGEERRMDTTVIADSVNLCSRLEGLCKLYGKGIIVPAAFFERLHNPKQYHFRHLGQVRVQGRKQPVHVIHIFDGLAEEEFNTFALSRENFEKAISEYQRGRYAEAHELFRELAKEFPQDPAIFTFMSRTHRLISTGMADVCEDLEDAEG